MQPIIRLFDPAAKQALTSVSGHYTTPPTFEELGIAHHLVLYETVIPNSGQDPAVLYAHTMDRGLIYVDACLAGTTSRAHEMYTIALDEAHGKRLHVLIENQGHLNFGNVVEDWKGLLDATFNNLTLSSWDVTGFKLNNIEPLRFLNNTVIPEIGTLRKGPIFLRGTFIIDGKPLDTYLDTTGWGKGVAYVNGFNLGRYWPLVGPQMTLYVPSAFLKHGDNELIILELEYLPLAKTMKFQNTADFG